MTRDVEEHLPGNLGGVFRLGNRVHRPVGYWTPAVHALLKYLEGRLQLIPRVHGMDDQGREVLDFLPGEVVTTPMSLTELQLISLVTWTREFHDAVSGFSHGGPWRSFPMPTPTEPRAAFIGHNDLAPYNSCFLGDELAGIFDWDLAGPTTAVNELAFIAWNCVPLCRPIEPRLAAARLQTIAETYGAYDAEQILLGVAPRIRTMLKGIPSAASAGDPGMKSLMTQGEPERSRASLKDLEKRIPHIRAHFR